LARLSARGGLAYLLICVAFSMAFANILIRLMTPTDPPNRIIFYYHIGGLKIGGSALYIARDEALTK
jgi:hypothetical protein